MGRGTTSKKVIRLLSPLLFLLVFLLSCKKSPFTPDPQDLTRPIIWISSFEMSFAASETGANPTPQTLKIKNSGQKSLNYTLSDDAGWLSIEPASGASSGGIVEHTVSVNKAGLAAQEAEYAATVTITCPEAYNNPQKVKATLKITKELPPEIRVNPNSLTFNAKEGSNPGPQILKVRNSGQGILTYGITWDASWLSVSPDSGTSGGEEHSHSVSVRSAELDKGTYAGTITVSGTEATNSPQRVNVTLEITEKLPRPTDNQMSVSCSPSSGGAGTLVNFPVSIKGNLKAIAVFGLEMVFDSELFQFQKVERGTLTGNWAAVDGNQTSSGVATIGGFKGSASLIPVGSTGSIVVVTLKVKAASYNNNYQSQVSIRKYTDDIAGMKPEPSATTFIYKK